MPTNRTRRTRKINPGISDNLRNYLLTGEREKGDAEVFLLSGSRTRLQVLWNAVKDEILPTWIEKHPCTRLWIWWEFDAPRWERKFDAYFDETKPEPRQRIGGTGTPDYEVLNYVPYFDKGIPKGWVTKFDEEYYNGRRKDIHGNPIGTEYKEGHFKGKAIDPNDPPVFESEAIYLDRHSLLTPKEKAYLKRHPDLMKPERVEAIESDK